MIVGLVARKESVNMQRDNESGNGERATGSRSEAARKGGQAVSRNREHMAAIGRKGGQTVSRDRQHMAEIGRKGGQR